MLDFRSIPDSSIVEFTVDGAVTREDFDAVIAAVESKIEDYGSVDLLEEIRSFGKIPPSVFLDDLTWAIRHMRDIGRVAIVCDKDWIERLVGLMHRLVKADVRHFDLDDIDAARKWLRASVD